MRFQWKCFFTTVLVGVLVLLIAALFEFGDYAIARQLTAFILFVGSILKGLGGWPTAFLLSFCVLVASGVGQSLATRLRSVSMFGFSAELSESGKRSIQRNVRDLVKVAESYRAELNDDIRGRVAARGLERKLERVFESVKSRFPAGALPKSFRCCIHIPDPMYRNRLYQLTRYVGLETVGEPGRTWPIGYGIIGRVWRSGQSVVEGDLIRIKIVGSPNVDANDRVLQIALHWGMTLTEAQRVRSKPSYLAILVQKDERDLCVIFADSTEKHAFLPEGQQDGKEELELINFIRQQAYKFGIEEDVLHILSQIEPLSPHVELEK